MANNRIRKMEDETGILLKPCIESVIYDHGMAPTENIDFMSMAIRRSVHHYFNDPQFKENCKKRDGNEFLSSFVSMWLTSWKKSQVNRDRMMKSFF